MGQQRLALTALAWGPGHPAAAEQVDVQMIHGLPAVAAGVDDGSIAGFGNSFLPRESCGQTHHATEQIRVGHVVERGDVLFWNDEDVGRRLRGDVPERDHLLVVDDRLRRNLAADDFAKNAACRLRHRLLLLTHPASRLSLLASRLLDSSRRDCYSGNTGSLKT